LARLSLPPHLLHQLKGLLEPDLLRLGQALRDTGHHALAVLYCQLQPLKHRRGLGSPKLRCLFQRRQQLIFCAGQRWVIQRPPLRSQRHELVQPLFSKGQAQLSP
jgi:hypothetical protein